MIGAKLSPNMMKAQMIPSEVMELMGVEGGKMVCEIRIPEFPTITVSLNTGILATISVEAHTDEFIP